MNRTAVSATFILLAISSLQAGILFSDDFNGSSADLDGTTPDVTTGGAAWEGAMLFDANGDVNVTNGGPGSVTLAFTPANGLVYTLDATITGVTTPAGDPDWIGFGFANGQSTATSIFSRFITNDVTGTAWMFVRGSGASVSPNAFLGTGSGSNGGITDGVAWVGPLAGTVGGDYDLRIVLDTTGGAGNWSATWFAKRPSDVDYSEVRAETAMLSESFDSVGFAASSGDVSGTITRFTLSDNGGGPDTTNPEIMTLSPADEAMSVAVSENLIATFDETITSGTGGITLKRTNDDSVVEAFNISSSTQLTIGTTTVTIDPTNDLDPGMGYYVQIDATAIDDAVGNSFAGILDKTSWSFFTASAAVGSIAPYAVDANTRHLWHFDEADPGPVAPAAGMTGSFSLTPANSASLGATGFTGFGTAGNSSANQDSEFLGETISLSSLVGVDGAYTFEAMVNISESTSIQQILSMERNDGNRPFQFRINAGNLELINIAGGDNVSAAIPTTGPNAFMANEWFHVAVTYDGNDNIAGNTKLYWTRVVATWVEANEITVGTEQTDDLTGDDCVFVVANSGRTIAGQDNNVEGLLDEVRISDIARGADAFLFLAPDTDNDGLADPWEILHFRESPGESDAIILAKFDGTDDPDNDTYDNEAEETAGTDPNDTGHTPFDADQDGYEDAWEIATFGTTIYGPADDPDGDGWTTAEELTAGTDPTNPVSDPDDTDADGMEDATETTLFGDLSQGPLDDYDGDGISNQGELSAGTDPTDPTDFPMVSFIPVSDGNAGTDENGYAGSAINSIAFAQNNLITVGDQQIISYYRRHATDAGHSDNNTVVVGRRTVGESSWEFFSTNFTSFNINDTHNVISCAIDGDGVLHMSWGMHAHPLLYAKSTTSVLGTNPIVMTSLGAAGMTGQENSVTYPKFQTLPDGDVVFLFREGGSGNGDWFLHRYDTDTDVWSPIHANGSGVSQPLMLGRGDSPDNCFYPDRMTLGPDGMLHLAGVFRYNGDSPAGESGYQTNHRYIYLRSPDGGTSWERSDGSTIDLPVVEAAWFLNLGASHVPGIVEDIPEGHSNMNEAGMTTDSAGRPIIANWWSLDALSGDHTRQYHIFFHDGTRWNRRTVSARDIDNPATKFSEGQLGGSKMGRPVVLTDADDRIIVVYNDNRFDGITVVFSLPLAEDPGRNNWTRMNLTTENIGNWETTYDEQRWKQDGVLQMLYQQLPGMGASYSGQNNSTPVSVVEWNAQAYFNSPILWAMDTGTTAGEAIFSARTRIGFRYELKTSTDLLFSEPSATTLPGNGSWQDFGSWFTNEPRRFWRMERTEDATNDL